MMIVCMQGKILKVLLVAVACMGLAVGTVNPNLSQEGDIQLPDGYASKIVYRPPLAGLSGIVTSHSGAVYVRHLGSAGGVKVSRLDVDQGTLTTVLDLSPGNSVSTIVGGPADTFFIPVDGEFRQVGPDGAYTVWGSSPSAGYPRYFTYSNRMLGISNDETAVLELFSDGSSVTLLTGLGLAYDVVASEDGTIFISDIGAGNLLRLDPGGTYTTVAAISPDNTDLVLDHEGDLYINNGASGFAQVNLLTGQFTQMTAPNAECRAIQSPADVIFDNSNRAVFASWVDNIITWADFSTGDGGRVIYQSWANSRTADIGPDDALYVGVNGCGSSVSSQIVRFTAEGSHSVYLDGLLGDINGLAFDSSGGLYMSLNTETSVGVYYVAQGTTTPTLVPDSAGVEVFSLAVDPTTGHVFTYSSKDQQNPSRILVVELSTQGKVGEYYVELPKAPMEALLDFAPNGTLYAFATEEARHMTGPEVDRWILRLDLTSGTSNIVAQINRVGCCPFGNFSVDASGHIWWVLNPDFLLYQISPGGEAELFASNLPIDAGYVNRNSNGDIFLNSPDGLYRVWIPRVYLPLVLR